MFKAFYKIFKTYDKATACFFMNILPPRSEFIFRRIKFLIKHCNSVNALVFFLCNRCGSIELEHYCVNKPMLQSMIVFSK